MRNLILVGTALTLIFTSCKKETVEKNIPSTTPDYTPLSIGNYWVYQYYSIDTLGNENQSAYLRDSIVINRDTVINGKTYFILEGINMLQSPEWRIISLLRDSSDYLVNAGGEILFSSTNFTDVLSTKTHVMNSDTLFTLQYSMQKESTVNVPAGKFTALNYHGTLITTHPPSYIKNPRNLPTYYAAGVGKILHSYYYLSSPTRHEKRLVKYYVK